MSMVAENMKMIAEKLIEKISQEQNESSKVVRIALAYAEFISLVRGMREAQEIANRAMAEADDYSEALIYVNKANELEKEVDEYLKKMEV